MRIYVLALGLAAAIAATPRAQNLYELDTIRTIHLTFAQSNWWQLLENNYNSRTYIRGNLIMDGQTYNSVGDRNSTMAGLLAAYARGDGIPFIRRQTCLNPLSNDIDFIIRKA